MEKHSSQLPDSAPKPTRELIAAAAYHLFIEGGSSHGHDVDDWLRAEQLLAERLVEATTEHNAAAVRTPLALVTEAQDERGSASREKIRRQSTPFRPAARQVEAQHHFQP